MNQENIGAFIAQTRKEKGMTQEQLSQILGTTQKSISRWENGKTMPDISLYEPLCQALDIQVSELLYGKKMTNEEKTTHIEDTALNVLISKSQLETLALLTEILVVVGIIITFTLTKFVASSIVEMIITLLSGWFVWGFGLVLRVKIRQTISKLEEK